MGESLRDELHGRRRPARFRDVVGAAAMATLLSLGVMGEMSGARTPDLGLHPEPNGGLGWVPYDELRCEWLDPTFNGRPFAANVYERAQRERIALRRAELDCGDWTGVRPMPPHLVTDSVGG